MAATAVLVGDQEPVFDIPTQTFCSSQSCHYLRLSTSYEEGELSSQQAIPWLTSNITADRDTDTIESRILFFARYEKVVGYPGLPVSATDLDKLVHDYHFPARFFTSELLFRRVAGHHITPNGHCWFLRTRYFSAVSMLQKGERVCQTIVFLEGTFLPKYLRSVLERCRRLQDMWKQPLLPIVVLLDFTLEEYRNFSSSTQETCHKLYIDLAKNKSYTTGISTYYHTEAGSADLSDLLTNLTMERHTISPAVGDLKSLLSSIEFMNDVSHTHSWDWMNTFEYLTMCTKDSLDIFSEADARYEFFTKDIQIRIAQRDTQISQELARNSAETAMAAKRDSSSMKIIAVLGTLFLPSTFVAAILSTPEYSNWPAGVTWRFWSIAMPLTAVIMIGLLFWFMYDTKQAQVTQSKEKDNSISFSSIGISHNGL